MLRSLQFLSLLCVTLAAMPANAQECAALSGRMRFACAVAKYPAFGAKVERCKDEARAMGLRVVRGDPAFRGYVEGCVRRIVASRRTYARED